MSTAPTDSHGEQRLPVVARVVGQIEVDPADHLTIGHQTLTGADFSGRHLESISVIGSRLERCTFERMHVEDACFGAGTDLSEFIDCSFDGSRLYLHVGGYARFVRCSFRKVDLRRWRANHVELVDCVFTGRLRSAMFWGGHPAEQLRRSFESHCRWLEKEGRPPPDEATRALMLREVNEFCGNDFSAADLRNVEFRAGIDLSRQALPTGKDYLYLPDLAHAINQALAALAQRPPDELTSDVDYFLRTVLGRHIAEGQRQMLIRAGDFTSRGAVRPHIAVALDLLRQAITEPPETPHG